MCYVIVYQLHLLANCTSHSFETYEDDIFHNFISVSGRHLQRLPYQHCHLVSFFCHMTYVCIQLYCTLVAFNNLVTLSDLMNRTAYVTCCPILPA